MRCSVQLSRGEGQKGGGCTFHAPPYIPCLHRARVGRTLCVEGEEGGRQ
jgi:hypothetical protein